LKNYVEKAERGKAKSGKLKAESERNSLDNSPAKC